MMGGFSQVGATGFECGVPGLHGVKAGAQEVERFGHGRGGGPLTVSATAYCG